MEVLVAVAIFVIVGALAMGGYNELVKQSDIVEINARRTRAVQRTVQRMVQDFATLEPRPVREPIGDSLEPALRADASTQPTRRPHAFQLVESRWRFALYPAARVMSVREQQAAPRLLGGARPHAHR